MSEDPINETAKGRATVWGLGYWGWAVLFVAAMFAAAAANRLGLIPARASLWVQLAPLVLVMPMARAQMALFGKHGVSSPALTRYNRDMLLTLGAFVVGLGGTAYLSRQVEPGKGAALALAFLAAAPVAGIIWSVARYLRDETDEFLRHKAVGALLISLFFVLAVGALWSALQMFGLAAPVMNWWILPAWGIGLGLGNLWQWTYRR